MFSADIFLLSYKVTKVKDFSSRTDIFSFVLFLSVFKVEKNLNNNKMPIGMKKKESCMGWISYQVMQIGKSKDAADIDDFMLVTFKMFIIFVVIKSSQAI